MKIFLFLILLSLNCKSVPDSKPIENPSDSFRAEQLLATRNIEFSVDKRNYLLHVPTGKITEVKEK